MAVLIRFQKHGLGFFLWHNHRTVGNFIGVLARQLERLRNRWTIFTEHVIGDKVPLVLSYFEYSWRSGCSSKILLNQVQVPSPVLWDFTPKLDGILTKSLVYKISLCWLRRLLLLLWLMLICIFKRFGVFSVWVLKRSSSLIFVGIGIASTRHR